MSWAASRWCAHESTHNLEADMPRGVNHPTLEGLVDEGVTPLLVAAQAWDVVEERRALSEIGSALFGTETQPVKVARYVLLEPLGRGGGGAVYRAFDPELHREVAIKLLRPIVADGLEEAQTRLMREAQAIAQLRHPNVVAVHDVGRVDAQALPGYDGGIFVVMELIDGVDLAAWAEAQARSWREVVDVLEQAALGLQAAHAQGLVHRDLKPTNLMIGADGRVRVVDFGLAGLGDDESLHDRRPALDGDPSSLRTPLTRVGAVMGTPAYMSPEQHAGERADARSDQYGLCATVWKLLFGAPPFDGDSPAELETNKRTRSPVAVASVRAPRWLVETLRRGLRPSPNDRFADLESLRAAVARGRARGGRIALVIVGLGLLFAAGVAIVSSRAEARAVDERCTRAGDRVEQVWSPAQAAEVREAFRATGVTDAGARAEAVVTAFDRYADEWRRLQSSSCRDAAAGELDDELLARRGLCLDRQLTRVDELVRISRAADARAVSQSDLTAKRLPEPSDCERVLGDDRLAGLDADARQARKELDEQLTRAGVQAEAGNYDLARESALAAVTRAEAVDDAYAEARAAGLLATIESNLGSREGRTWSRRALTAAERSGDDRSVVSAATAFAKVECGYGEPAVAELAVELGRARARRIEGPLRAELDAQLSEAEGFVLLELGRPGEALASLAEAVPFYEGTLPLNTSRFIALLNRMGQAAGEAQRWEQGRAHFRRAVALVVDEHGTRHLLRGLLLNNWGGLELDAGRPASSFVLAREALAVKRANVGPDSPMLVTTYDLLAKSCLRVGDVSAALQWADVLEAFALRNRPDEDPLHADPWQIRTAVYATKGDCAGAAAANQRALAIDPSPNEYFEGELRHAPLRCPELGGSGSFAEDDDGGSGRR